MGKPPFITLGESPITALLRRLNLDRQQAARMFGISVNRLVRDERETRTISPWTLAYLEVLLMPNPFEGPQAQCNESEA